MDCVVEGGSQTAFDLARSWAPGMLRGALAFARRFVSAFALETRGALQTTRTTFVCIYLCAGLCVRGREGGGGG